MLDMGQAFQIGIDAADDIAAGLGTGEDESTHNHRLTHRGTVLKSCADAPHRL